MLLVTQRGIVVKAGVDITIISLFFRKKKSLDTNENAIHSINENKTCHVGPALRLRNSKARLSRGSRERKK